MITIILIAVFVISCLVVYYQRVGRLFHYLSQCPSIPCKYPFVGNLPLLTGGLFKTLPNDPAISLLSATIGFTKLFKEFYVFWFAWNPLVVIFSPELIEKVLSSNKLIEKSNNYNLLHPWLGNGLLTSGGHHWRLRRKLLTPAFHFKILNDFIPIIADNSNVLVDKIRALGGQAVDVRPLITACTLDIICETAMGLKINAQNDSDSEYVKSVYVLGKSFMKRTVDPIAWFDFIYYLTSDGRQYKKCLKNVHDFTRQVIAQRKQELKNRLESDVINEDSDSIGAKKRKAFLDLLLEQHMSDQTGLTEEDIREEVDTFMFEGHDTTAVSLCWTLFLIGSDPDVQNKVDSDIEDVFGCDTSRAITAQDLSRLKYLECCIKESLRLYPSVPAIARQVTEDFQLKSYTIPKGTTFHLHLYALHRNEQLFPQPEHFRPDRFMQSVGDNTAYAFVPFSAGPRNCIGQRFAMTELKLVLISLLRQFKLRSTVARDEVRPAMELVTRARDPIMIEFTAKYQG